MTRLTTELELRACYAKFLISILCKKYLRPTIWFHSNVLRMIIEYSQARILHFTTLTISILYEY